MEMHRDTDNRQYEKGHNQEISFPGKSESERPLIEASYGKPGSILPPLDRPANLPREKDLSAAAHLDMPSLWGSGVEKKFMNDKGVPFAKAADSPAQTFELNNLSHRSANHHTPDAVVRLPENFDPAKPINLVIYNHGFGSNARSAFAQNKLGDHMAGAPPNTVLVVPEWQQRPGSRSGSQGQLRGAGEFKGMLQEVFDKTPGLKGKTLKDVKDISIFAHSAGYGPTETEIYKNGLADKVKSITLLDALYDNHGFDRWLHDNIKELSQGKKQFNNFFFGTAGASKDQADRVMGMLKSAGLPASRMVEDYHNGGKVMDSSDIANHSIVFKYSSATDGTGGGPHLSMPGLYVGQVEKAAARKAAENPAASPDRPSNEKPATQPGTKPGGEKPVDPAEKPVTLPPEKLPDSVQASVDESRKILENPQSLLQQKLTACSALYESLPKDNQGRVHVTLNDGGQSREFEIASHNFGKGVKATQVFARDADNNEHPVLRFVERNHKIEQQRDSRGAKVAYEGKWWSENVKSSTISRSSGDNRLPAPPRPDGKDKPGTDRPVASLPATPAPSLPAQKLAPDVPAPMRTPQNFAPDNMEPRRSNDQPSAHAPVLSAGKLDTLKSDIERARSGGRALTIAQIGDSHIKFGAETPALAARLAANTGLQAGKISYSSVGDIGKTASYANEHPGEFLVNINRNTDLVVVSFGSNEAGAPVGRKYVNDYAGLIRKIRGKAPQAAIVMVGPTDGNYWKSSRHLPYLDAVASAQQRVAANVSDSAYLKIGSQMGSVAAMRRNGLMAADNLHLTAKGYQKLGSIIADDITAVLRQ
jgi:lysophospholipase L1-like esterase